MKFKPRVNLVIDALMMLCTMAVGGLGFLIRYVLPPGHVRRAMPGQPGPFIWLGMDRHQWGEIHLWLGVAFLVLLVLHIVLHWQQIVALYKILIPQRAVRIVIAMVFVLLCFVAIAFPLWVRGQETSDGSARGPWQEQGGRGYRGGRGAPVVQTPFIRHESR